MSNDSRGFETVLVSDYLHPGVSSYIFKGPKILFHSLPHEVYSLYVITDG